MKGEESKVQKKQNFIRRVIFRVLEGRDRKLWKFEGSKLDYLY